jgi:8-oxo-dGTP diphosphatase
MVKKIRNIWSAGGVIVLQKKSRTFVAICNRKSENLFALPKGRPEKNEDYKQTAIREVKEETGIDTKIIKKISTTTHYFGVKDSNQKTITISQSDLESNNDNITIYKKTVHWYLLKYLSGDFFMHDNEFDSVKWIEISVAKNKITHKNEKDVLGKVLAIFKK